MSNKVSITIGGAVSNDFNAAFDKAIGTINQMDSVLNQVNKTSRLMQRIFANELSVEIAKVAGLLMVVQKGYGLVNRYSLAKTGASLAAVHATGLGGDLAKVALRDFGSKVAALGTAAFKASPYIVALGLAAQAASEIFEIFAADRQRQRTEAGYAAQADRLQAALLKRVEDEVALGKLAAEGAAILRRDIQESASMSGGHRLLYLGQLRQNLFPGTLPTEAEIKAEAEFIKLKLRSLALSEKEADLYEFMTDRIVARGLLLQQQRSTIDELEQLYTNKYNEQFFLTDSNERLKRDIELRELRLQITEKQKALDEEIAKDVALAPKAAPPKAAAAKPASPFDAASVISSARDERAEQERYYQQSSFGGQLGQGLIDVTGAQVDPYTGKLDELAAAARQTAGIITSTIGSAITTISDQITQVVMGTVSWGEALLNIGRTILSTLIQSIIQFFVTWIVRRIALALFDKALTTAAAASAAAAWAAPAILASTATFGAASATGLAAVTGSMAAAPGIAALASLGSLAPFAEGGFTGAGPRWEPAGIVHRGEFVLPALAVDRIGVPALEALSAGESRAGGPVPRVSIALLDDSRQTYNSWLESQEAEQIIVRHVARHRRRIS